MLAGDDRKYFYEYAEKLLGHPIMTHEYLEHAEKLKELSKPDFLKVCKSAKNDGWIPVEERLPESTDYILLSFSNFSLPTVGRYEEDSEGGAFYLGDDEETCVSQGLYVNAWRPLPEPYQPETAPQRPEWKDRMLHTFLGGHHD